MKISIKILFVLMLIAVMASACGKVKEPEYIAKSLEPGFELGVCLDGMYCPDDLAEPFIYGGRDYRQPTADVVEQWRRLGHVSKRTKYSKVVKEYQKQGYVLPFLDGISNCKGHVLTGGNCLAAPLPGTPDYEKLLKGASR